MEQDHQSYCIYNEQGYCKFCGRTKPNELNGAWPRETWFQRRRAYLLEKEASELRTLPSSNS